MKYFKHFAHCGNKLKQQQQQQQQHPSNLLSPVFLPQQLVDCNCQTHKLKTRPIINHRHPSRSRALHENMKIKIKPKLSTKFHLTIFLKLLFECACAIIIIERESKERISSGICSSCSTLNGCHSPQSPAPSLQCPVPSVVRSIFNRTAPTCSHIWSLATSPHGPMSLIKSRETER